MKLLGLVIATPVFLHNGVVITYQFNYLVKTAEKPVARIYFPERIKKYLHISETLFYVNFWTNFKNSETRVNSIQLYGNVEKRVVLKNMLLKRRIVNVI